jgi:hypothetical protein
MEPRQEEELLRLALSQYAMAQKIAPGNPRTSFRLGMTYNLLAGLIREEKVRLSDDYIAVARQEFTDIVESDIVPFGDSIGNTFYFLPYHALYHRAATYAIENDVARACEEFRSLLRVIDQEFEAAPPKWKNVLRLLRGDVEGVLEAAKDYLPFSGRGNV